MNESLKNYIKIYDNALEPDFCKTLVEDFENDWVNQTSVGLDKPIVVTKNGEEIYLK